MLCFFWAAMARYQIDFLPALLLLGLIGALGVERWVRVRGRWRAVVIHAALAMALVASICFGAVQSVSLYGNLRRLNPRAFARIAYVFNTPAFLWENLTRAPHGPLELELRITPRAPGTREPLVSTGLASKNDRLLVVHENGGIRLSCVHDGGAEWASRVLPIDAARTHRLRVAMGSLFPPEESPYFAAGDPRERVRLTRWWRLEWDGEVLIERYQRFHPASPATVRIGAAAILPRAGEARFSGEILRVARAAPNIPAMSGGRGVATPADFTAVRMKLAFAATKSGAREPLVSAGDIGHADFIFVEYLAPQRIRFGFDHWGKPARFSEPVTVPASVPCIVEIALGSFGRETGLRREAVAPVRVQVDGRVVWEFSTKLYPIEPEDVFVGQNPIGGSSSETAFSGVISSVEWLRGERAIQRK
jgi:hypothetical protein